MPTFSHDWFSNNIGNWTKWLAPFRGKPIRALEIGCYEGRATTWLLENILTHQDSTITVIDTFEGSEEHKDLGVSFSKVLDTFTDNVKPWESKVRICIGRSAKMLGQLIGTFDLAYIDGSHKSPDVLTDACLTWPLIKVGGIVLFDDYLWKGYPDPTHNPQLGIDSFLACFRGSYELIAQEYQVALRKTA